MATIKLIDVSMRDGNQSLWGATGMTTQQIEQIAPILDRAGLYAIDFTSSTHMGIAVRTHKQCPWERIRRAHAAMPNTPLQFIGTGLRFISWESSHPDFMQLAYNKLVENGLHRYALLEPNHDMDNLLTNAAMVRKAGAHEIVGALTFTISEIHSDDYFADIAAQMAASPNIDRVYIKDPSGLMSPERARTLIPAVIKRLNGKPLELHSHTTIAYSPLSYMEAAALGVEILHTACGPLANGSSLPNAERIAANLREFGHTVDVDDRLLAQAADYFLRIAEVENRPIGRPQEFDAAFLRHQIAGGVMTTTRRQLSELKLEHRFDEVVHEVGRVRAELGYPIMVTPFAQMVCTQALYNVISTERYSNVSDQVIRYVLGKFGRPAAPVDGNVKDRILALRRAKELNVETPALSPTELRKRFKPGISDEELILRATMPAEEVDAMLAAGPAPKHYNPDAQPLLTLLKELSQRPSNQEIRIEKPGFKLRVGKQNTEVLHDKQVV